MAGRGVLIVGVFVVAVPVSTVRVWLFVVRVNPVSMPKRVVTTPSGAKLSSASRVV